MALLGYAPTLRWSSCGTPLVGKVAHLCRVNSIRIAVPTVLDELRCGHITSVSFGMGQRELFWEKCLTVVPCATADEESGSSLKIGSCVGQHYVLPGTRKTCFENPFFQMNPCIKFAFRKLNLALSLNYSVRYILFIPLCGCGWTCWVCLYSPHS